MNELIHIKAISAYFSGCWNSGVFSVGSAVMKILYLNDAMGVHDIYDFVGDTPKYLRV